MKTKNIKKVAPVAPQPVESAAPKLTDAEVAPTNVTEAHAQDPVTTDNRGKCQIQDNQTNQVLCPETSFEQVKDTEGKNLDTLLLNNAALQTESKEVVGAINELVNKDVNINSLIYSKIPYYKGYYINSHNELISDEEWAYTDYIPVKGGEVISFKGSDTIQSTKALCEIDSEGTLLDSWILNKPIRTITLRAETSKIRYCFELSIVNNVFIKSGDEYLFNPNEKLIDYVKDIDDCNALQNEKIETLEQKVENINVNDVIYSKQNYVLNTFKNGTSETPSESYSYVSIPVQGGENITFDLTGESSGISVLFELDENGKQIELWANLDTPRKITLQSETRTLIANFENTYKDKASIILDNGENIFRLNEDLTIKEAVEDIDDRLSNNIIDLEEHDSIQDERISQAEEKINGIDVNDIIYSKQNYVLNTFKNATSESTSDTYSYVLIPVNGGENITFDLTGHSTGISILFELDTNGKQIELWANYDTPRKITLQAETRTLIANFETTYKDDATILLDNGENIFRLNEDQTIKEAISEFDNRLSNDVRDLKEQSSIQDERISQAEEDIRGIDVNDIMYSTLNYVLNMYYEYDVKDFIPIDGYGYMIIPIHGGDSFTFDLMETLGSAPNSSNRWVYELDSNGIYVDHWGQSSHDRTFTSNSKSAYLVANFEISYKDKATVIDSNGVNLFNPQDDKTIKQAIEEIDSKEIDLSEITSDVIQIKNMPSLSKDCGNFIKGSNVNGMSVNSFLSNALGISDSIKFLHLSDTHRSNIAVSKTDELLNKDNTYAFGIITGDLETTPEMASIFESNEKIYLMTGNHDVGSGSQKTANDRLITPYMTTRANMGDDENIGSWWYKDVGKLRIIALDEYDYDRVGHAVHVYGVVYTQKQMDWFINLLKETPSDKYIILCHHQPPSVQRDKRHKGKFISQNAFNNYEFMGNLQDPALMTPRIIDAYLNKGQLTGSYECGNKDKTMLTFNEDFSTVTPAHFLFHLAGHTHWDVCEYLPLFPNQLLLTIDCANPDKYGASDLERSTNPEDISSYVINDVTVDFGNKITIINRIGACVTDDGTIRDTITFPII